MWPVFPLVRELRNRRRATGRTTSATGSRTSASGVTGTLTPQVSRSRARREDTGAVEHRRARVCPPDVYTQERFYSRPIYA